MFKFTFGNKFKFFGLPLAIAIWSILQSMAHVWWIVFGRAMIACEVQVTRKIEFYLYMTYLYSTEGCDDIALKSYAKIHFNNASSSFTLLHGPHLLFRDDGAMTKDLLNIYVGVDSFWIVTSVGLLIGVLLRLKQGSALLFYIPWILISVTILAMDIFTSVYYALKLPATEVTQDDEKPWFLDNFSILSILCGRLGFLCVINIFNCAYIVWYTRASYKQRYSDENLRRRRKPQMRRRQETENRIKNWQLFYGEIDDSTESRGKSFIHDEDLTYAITFKELEDYNHKRKKLEGSASEHELCSTFKSSSSLHQNANQPPTPENTSEVRKRVQIMELDSHLPWSYMDSSKQKMADVLHKQAQDGDRRLWNVDKDANDTTAKKVTVLEPLKPVTTSNEQEQISRF